MAKYVITYPILTEESIGRNQTTLKEYIVYDEELANKIVDEILNHRATGHKTAFLLFLEHELSGKFKRESNSVVYIDKIETTRIRKEGGAYDMLKKAKETI